MSPAATRIETGPAGDVFEVASHAVRFELVRDGVARYRLGMVDSDGESRAFQLWTTQKGRIDFAIVDGELHESGLQHEFASDGSLQSLRGGACLVHLEHLDRGLYHLDFSIGMQSLLMLLVQSPGYIKVRRVDGDPAASDSTP